MSNKKEHDTQELYINEINWAEIKRGTKIAFKVSFVFLTILVLIMLFLPSPARGMVEVVYIYIYIYIYSFLGFLVVIINYLVDRSTTVFFRLISSLLVGVFIGLIYIFIARIASLLNIFSFTLLLIPFLHLARYENAKFSKYLWGGVSGVFGFAMLILLFILLERVTPFLLWVVFPLIPFGIVPFIVFIAVSLASAVAFYWFFISLAEEIYRIKFEEAGNSNPKSKF